MLSIRFDMPLWLMGLYGGIMAVCVLLLRLLLGRHLPKRVFPVLWAVVLIRLFVPFSISSPCPCTSRCWERGTADWVRFGLSDRRPSFNPQ